MEEVSQLVPFELSVIAELFGIEKQEECSTLAEWMQAQYTFNELENNLMNELYERSKADIDYWNEEELKVQMIGLLFFIANVNTDRKIKVFYERRLSTEINEYLLSVICDCKYLDKINVTIVKD